MGIDAGRDSHCTLTRSALVSGLRPGVFTVFPASALSIAMIEIEIDDRLTAAALERLVKAAKNPAPLMRGIAAVLMDAVEENFAQQGRPKWQGLKPGGRQGQILQDTGRLASSISPSSDATSAMVGTNVKYAAIHQFGGQTRPHVIRPRNKRALAFGGRVVRSVNHPGSNIPARPFLMLTDGDEDEIEATAADYLRRVIDG